MLCLCFGIKIKHQQFYGREILKFNVFPLNELFLIVFGDDMIVISMKKLDINFVRMPMQIPDSQYPLLH